MEKQIKKRMSEWLEQQSSKEKIAEAVADLLIEEYTKNWNTDNLKNKNIKNK